MTVEHSNESFYMITAEPTSTNTELQKTYNLHLKIVSNDFSEYQSSITVNFYVTVLAEY